MSRFVCFRTRQALAPVSGWYKHPYAVVFHYWQEGQARSLCSKWWMEERCRDPRLPTKDNLYCKKCRLAYEKSQKVNPDLEAPDAQPQ